MLSYNLLLQQAENRRAQRTPKALSAVLQHIHQQDYQNLIEWIFENSDIMKLSCSTKFLARTFFDSSILEPSFILYDHYIYLAMAALALAIKFNESREVSERLTLENLLKSVDIYLSKSDFIDLETKVMRSLSYVFRYTSPSDYLDVFMERFPFFPNFRPVLLKLIELALMRPNACSFKAEELFFGAVLALIKTKKQVLTPLQNTILLSMTDCWQKAQSVFQMISQAINLAQNEQNSA